MSDIKPETLGYRPYELVVVSISSDLYYHIPRKPMLRVRKSWDWDEDNEPNWKSTATGTLSIVNRTRHASRQLDVMQSFRLLAGFRVSERI